MAKGNKFVRGVKIAVAVLAVLVMSVWSMILYSDAFIDWWIVTAVTLGVGIATAIHMWKWWITLTVVWGVDMLPTVRYTILISYS